MHRKVTTADQTIARLAAPAYGIVTRIELIDARVSDGAIRTRIKRGSLVVVFRGVYRVGGAPLTPEARYMAAIKAGGDAVLSGEACAHHFGFMRGRPPQAEITAPTKRRIKGVTAREIVLPPDERTTYNRIPCTTPARTLLDLAQTLDPPTLSRVVHAAQIRFRRTQTQIEKLLARHPNAKGSWHLRRIINGDEPIVLSKMEEAFIKLLRKHRLPLPQTNKHTDGHYVDCRWPDHSLTVELDSYRFHNSRHSWDDGHRRRRAARARGDEFRTYAYSDVCEDPGPMLAELRPLLAA